MRELKFRGKSIKDWNDVWHYGIPVPNYKENGIEFNYIKNSFGKFQVYPETVGQFTGCFDKNNKEIYEDDIVKVEDGSLRVIVFINEGAPGFQMKSFNEENQNDEVIWHYDVKIIGNKYDFNLPLVEKTKRLTREALEKQIQFLAKQNLLLQNQIREMKNH